MSTPVTKKLAALLLATACAPAWALTPADGAPELSLYLPGSQANDPVYGFLINGTVVANALCLDPATPDGTGTTTHIYFHNASPATPTAAVNDNYSAIYCYTDSTKIDGLTGGVEPNNKTRLWISRHRLGASFIGMDAVANNTTLTYLKDPTTASCTSITGGATFTSGGVGYQFNYSCATATAGIHATAGSSDVTPDVLHGTDKVTYGYSDIDVNNIGNKYAIAGHIIGTPVTLHLRNALQYAESKSGLIPSTCLPGDETAACVPTLSKQQLASVFSGQIANWSAVKVNVGGIAKTLPQVVADGVTAGVANLTNPSDSKVHICRRENGAGQQVALLANILQYPCLGPSGPTIAQPGGTPADVQYATSLGAVDNCLTDYNNGPNASGVFKFFGVAVNPFPYPSPPASTAGKQWAISIQTTERNATRSAPYRFIRIDGALPTGEQVFLGHYPLVGEYSLAWNTGSDDNVEAALNAVVSYAQQPSTVAARNGSISNHSWGQAGYVALSANGFTPPAIWNTSTPTTPYTHASSGAADSCSIPVLNNAYSTFELR